MISYNYRYHTKEGVSCRADAIITMKKTKPKSLFVYVIFLILILLLIGLLMYQNFTFITFLLNEHYLFSSFYTQLNLTIFILALFGLGTILLFYGIEVLGKILSIIEQKKAK